MSTQKKGMFVLADGKNVLITFLLVSSLFLIWGVCNSMIDTMDKHFQDQLGLTKAQSAWVQFAHYMGYALMALPAGLITRRIGYKGGIIFGLMLVALGGCWFWPATQINEFWAFLLGVCAIAMGLTVLETVANPYTTVLGPREYGPSRINLAQSCNGVGWIVGPIIASMFFYSDQGVEKAQGQLFIPYVGIAVVVVAIAITFIFAYVPDIKVEDEYHTDDAAPGTVVAKEKSRTLILLFLFLNICAVGLSLYLILNTILPNVMSAEAFAPIGKWLPYVIIAGVALTIPLVTGFARRTTSHSIWAHPHFSGATLAQFLYVAAQAGIFSFFINSMTVDKNNGYTMVPALPASTNDGVLKKWGWVESRVAMSPADIVNFSSVTNCFVARNTPSAAFLADHLSSATKGAIAGSATNPAVAKALPGLVLKNINEILRSELNSKLGEDDVKDAPALAKRLTDKSDPVSAFLAEKLSKRALRAIDAYKQDASPKNLAFLQFALSKDLNKVIGNTELYTAERFAQATVGWEAKKILAEKRQEKCWGRLNRLLLESVYATELARLPILYDPARFDGVKLADDTKKLAEEAPTEDNARLRLNRMLLRDAMPGEFAYNDNIKSLSDKGAGNLSAIAFAFFLLGRITGAGLMRRASAHKVLGLYGWVNVLVCGLVIAKLGWLSVVAVFASYFFMSIMFPTIFALGISGLGTQSKKKASAFIVMSITGGALMPKFMGHLGDVFNMSAAFWMPFVCFVLIGLYGFNWSRLSHLDDARGINPTGGH